MCEGCGLSGGSADGPTHPYILSSPHCWALYTELLATGAGGQLAVDAYSVQHPGIPERRSIQSVGAHLVSLCAAFEGGWPPHRAAQLLKKAVDLNPGWRWLDPEPPLGTITIADVIAVEDWADRTAVVERWAQEMWTEYEAHHDLVREWLATIIGE
jgi:hypothetical protein